MSVAISYTGHTQHLIYMTQQQCIYLIRRTLIRMTRVIDVIPYGWLTIDEIYKIICNFKDSAAGWDDLRPRIMKLIQNCIKSPLAHICNRSFVTGIFPSELRIANVVPIFKSGDDMVFSNYRPVSVLPVLSKILERLVCIIDWSCTSIAMVYYMNINLDFKRARPLIWL